MSGRPLIGITVGAELSPAFGWPVLSIRSAYARAVSLGGGAPVLIPPGLEQDDLRSIFERLDGLVISGGGDIAPQAYEGTLHPALTRVDPERDRVEFALVRWAVAEDRPLFGICRGHQAINVALGGTLIQDIPSQHDTSIVHNQHGDVGFELLAHHVDVTAGSALHRALGANGTQVPVNSLHHQAIASLGAGLTITGYSEDGLIEGIEIPGNLFAVGVQWHPESLVERQPEMLRLFTALVDAAAQHVR